MSLVLKMVALLGPHIAQSENIRREAGFGLVKKWSPMVPSGRVARAWGRTVTPLNMQGYQVVSWHRVIETPSRIAKHFA